MRRSRTVIGTTEEARLRPVAHRSATMSPCLPSVHVVERSLDLMGLNECEDSIEEESDTPIPNTVEQVVIDQEEPEVRDREEEVSQQESDSSVHTEEPDNSSQVDGEVGCKEEIWEMGTPETSVDESHSSDCVHKPLKDLIFKTNKEFYDIDSNKVRYKVGLSRRAAMIPSLHKKRE